MMRNIRLCVQKLKTRCVCIGVGICFACEAAGSGFSIVLPTEPKPWERTAAKELEACLSQMGGRLSVACAPTNGLNGPNALNGTNGLNGSNAHNATNALNGLNATNGFNAPVFHVGDTALAREKGLVGLEDERWVIRSFGGDVILNGGGSHGAIYAVSHFLEDVVGVRFWNDNDTDIPQSKGLTLSALDLSGRPVFRYRDIYRCGDPKKATPRFAMLRRLNRNGDAHVPQEWGGEFTYGPPYHCHTFDRMIPWKKYGKEHPEWFSLWEGKRTGGVESGQLCISNPEVRALLLKVLRENIAKGDAAAKAKGVPAPRVYELSMNDSKKYCQCEKCMAEVAKYDFSGFYLNLVNEIADEIAKTRPELYFSMLTYL